MERAFEVTGADTPPWPDPHLGPDGEDTPVREEEYSRRLDPGKHRILAARAEAWAQVLVAKGWAEREEIADGAALLWRAESGLPLHRAMVSRPHRRGASPLLLVRTAPDEEDGHHDLTTADARAPRHRRRPRRPTAARRDAPFCGCDACDSGSRDLLERLDEAILSIVDGSYEALISPHGRRERTSFHASSGWSVDQPAVPAHLTAGPWAENWTPRLMDPMLEPEDRA
ncbi:DUF6226 family protein [Brachybacterium sp. GPGPB12]|uniref:DUF6226 family protein n=1 Tax=Brachybacterium sp. GPGPB12 TaxID=3023517 RepID=UPI0031342605